MHCCAGLFFKIQVSHEALNCEIGAQHSEAQNYDQW